MPLLEVQELSLQVRLGCTREERSIPQEVRLGIQIEFHERPPACETDKLSDTICYAEICNALVKTTSNKEFQTIEYLTVVCAKEISGWIDGRAKAVVRVHKVKPPVPQLLGGVSFSIMV